MDFCGMVEKLVPDAAGQRGLLSDILKAITEPAVKALAAAVATLYQDHRHDTAIRRETIRTQLDAAKWPEFI
jgi:hypothetical protein